MVIPKGTIIQIGHHPDVSKSAWDVKYKLATDVLINKRKSMSSYQGSVIENPNGWHSSNILHTIDLDYDIIFGKDGVFNNAGNKAMKFVLQNMED